MRIIDLLSNEEKKKCSSINLKRGQILFHEEEECKYVSLVNKGSIQIVSYTLSGTEIIYNQINENGLFGNNLLFSDHPYYKGNVVAKDDSEILLISKANLLTIFKNNGKFLEYYLSYQANFSKKLNGTIKLLSISSAEERFLYFLKENEPLRYKSITSLAESLFLTRETCSRLISRLSKEKKIIVKGKIISLPHQ